MTGQSLSLSKPSTGLVCLGTTKLGRRRSRSRLAQRRIVFAYTDTPALESQRQRAHALSGDLVRDFSPIRPRYYLYRKGFDLDPGLLQPTNGPIVWKRLAALTMTLEVQQHGLRG